MRRYQLTLNKLGFLPILLSVVVNFLLYCSFMARGSGISIEGDEYVSASPLLQSSFTKRVTHFYFPRALQLKLWVPLLADVTYAVIWLRHC